MGRIRGKLFILKCQYLRKNIKIDEGLTIKKKLLITGKGRVSIGKNCVIDGIKGDASQYVSINTYSRDASISIGDNAHLCAARISSRFCISIGSSVLIEESGIVDTDFHSIERDRGRPQDESLEKCKVVIGDRVAIGSRSFVMKGVHIGDDAKIFPGSIVTTSVKAGALVLGNPARVLRES
jgi:acetyltransferase-like isoleucine patch superfamily enzyme